jgi:hypothetical protein
MLKGPVVLISSFLNQAYTRSAIPPEQSVERNYPEPMESDGVTATR